MLFLYSFTPQTYHACLLRVLEIEIDYDSLDDSLKDLQNVTEVKEREMQLISDISKTYKKLEAQRMPNMNDQRVSCTELKEYISNNTCHNYYFQWKYVIS